VHSAFGDVDSMLDFVEDIATRPGCRWASSRRSARSGSGSTSCA
jgi:hypothetical protein